MNIWAIEVAIFPFDAAVQPSILRQGRASVSSLLGLFKTRFTICLGYITCLKGFDLSCDTWSRLHNMVKWAEIILLLLVANRAV